MPAKKLLALAALSLAAGSSAASAQSAASLSIAQGPVAQRAGAGLDEAGNLRGGYTVWIVGAITLGILIFVIMELGDDNNLPGSP
jgi:hypothetical protein